MDLTNLINTANTFALIVKGLDPANLTADELQTAFAAARKNIAVVKNVAKAANIVLVDPHKPATS